MSHVWQSPYVNVFKHFNLQTWMKAAKEGDVSTVMDKSVKCTVYRIVGSIPASNYIQLPKTSSQSVGLTGRYMYLLFKPIPSRYFVVHVDVATQDGLIVRISFSNLFKEFKSTSTWLQFPFVCHSAKGSICAYTAVGSKDLTGPAPLNTQWTLLALDLQYILSMYLNRRYSYTKNIRLCANMLVKNVFTSDFHYEPGLTLEQAKKIGPLSHGMAPLPREMSFPLAKGKNWDDVYDLIRFPSESFCKKKKPFDSVQCCSAKVSPKGAKQNGTSHLGTGSPKRIEAVSGSRAVERTVAGSKVSKPKSFPFELPLVGVDKRGNVSVTAAGDGEVHVYAHPDERVVVHQENKRTGKITKTKLKAPGMLSPKKDNYNALEPDPILKLRRIVGFGGCTTSDLLWTSSGTLIVYPCHAVIVAMEASNGHQHFFVGHTDKVSAISLNGNSTLLASGQTGCQSVVRLWKVHTTECLAMFKTHVHSLFSLSFSHSGTVLCGVGKDGHGKNMVVIWNTDRASTRGQVSVMAKAHTDVDIVRMRIAAFDDTRMVSCGRDNVRLWRVKDGTLRSAPVNLLEYHSMEFTDCCFEAGYEATRDPLDRIVYACSRTGHIFEIDYRKVTIQHVRRLLPVNASSKKEKQTFNSGGGIAINCMCVNEAFCVTGSEDGFLRLWPLDFKHVYLEAEHEGPVSAVDISSDGMRILAGTSMGNIGILDVSSRGYMTVMRSHTAHILAMSVDPIRRHLATVAEDHTIRVWDVDTMQQLYDFTAPKECPTTITYHPSEQIFACGFVSGAVRIFNVGGTTMLAEHKQHRGKVIGVAFSIDGRYLYSAGSLGSIALYDASNAKFQLLRLLGNTIVRGESHGPNALAVSPDGKCVAFVGPTEFTVTVVDGRTLDEVLRIDITSVRGCSDGAGIDTATQIKYAHYDTKTLLVTTSSNKLLKFHAKNGSLVSEVNNIHRNGCTALDVSPDGCHLATAGDRVVKIWDYGMRLDLNFQVFIGHSESISSVMFSPDGLGMISVGEAIFLWDFLASPSSSRHSTNNSLEGRQKVTNYYTGEDEEYLPYKSAVQYTERKSFSENPRDTAPHPTSSFNPDCLVGDISDIRLDAGLMGNEVNSQESESQDEIEYQHNQCDEDAILSVAVAHGADVVKVHEENRGIVGKKQHVTATSPSRCMTVNPPRPTAHKHFQQKVKNHALAQRRYAPPPNQAGLKLKSVIGYNGNGRGNMVWHPDTGLFIYTCGCIVIIEDLSLGTQRHLMGHSEEVSTLALQHDSTMLASASGSFGISSSQICLWSLEDMYCVKVLAHHEFDVVCMAYSRDDRFLVSVGFLSFTLPPVGDPGDYRDCTIAVWSTHTYDLLTTTKTSFPVHDLKWDPSTANEFASVGDNGTLLFWLLDETQVNVTLNVHQADVPDDLLQKHHMTRGEDVSLTCLEYGTDSSLYVASSNGKVSVWDTRHNTCFMHWDADTDEIDTLISHSGRLITGGAGRNLRLWSVVGVAEMKLPGDNNNMRRDGLTMEDEMNLDGMIVSASFDEPLEMGIVGTSAGTLWYINWTERTSIRLVSGHICKINAIALCGSAFFASCADDGSLRVWSVKEREQTLQFQVMNQSCNCLAFCPVISESGCKTTNTLSNLDAAPVVATKQQEEKLRLPNIVAGYSDGTVRMFDLGKVEMALKMHPHATAVTAISFSSDGRMILSGSSDGLIAIGSATTGMTVRVINDHKGAPITCLDVSKLSLDNLETISSPELWLAASADRRVSVWSADWSKDFCELIDWLTFPAPAFTPDGTAIRQGDNSYFQQVPPSLVQFSLEEPDTVVYTGYGMHKQVLFYSLAHKKILRTVKLSHWATSMDMCPGSPLFAVGNSERLLKLIDYYEGSFQDFVGHNDSVQLVKFSSDGSLFFSASHAEILVWEVVA